MIYIESGAPKSFPRLNGKYDKEGILCIGKAVNCILNAENQVMRKKYFFQSEALISKQI